MDTTLAPGARCRALRAVSHQRGSLRRGEEGTVFSMRENLGRQLVTVDFESGNRLVLFSHELEPVAAPADSTALPSNQIQ